MVDENKPGSPKHRRAADKGRGPDAAFRDISLAEPIDRQQGKIGIEEERQERAFEAWRQRSDMVECRAPVRDFGWG